MALMHDLPATAGSMAWGLPASRTTARLSLNRPDDVAKRTVCGISAAMSLSRNRAGMLGTPITDLRATPTMVDREGICCIGRSGPDILDSEARTIRQ